MAPAELQAKHRACRGKKPFVDVPGGGPAWEDGKGKPPSYQWRTPGKKQPCVPTHFTQEAWGPSTDPITPFLHACVGIRIASKTKKGGNKLTCGISNMTQNSLSMK